MHQGQWKVLCFGSPEPPNPPNVDEGVGVCEKKNMSCDAVPFLNQYVLVLQKQKLYMRSCAVGLALMFGLHRWL